MTRAGDKFILEVETKKFLTTFPKKLKFHKKSERGLVIGDNVRFDVTSFMQNANDSFFGEGKIVEIFPRKNYFRRAAILDGLPPQGIASNLDRIIVLASVLPRMTPFGLIDRILIAAELCQPVEILLVWNKADLLANQNEFFQDSIVTNYREIGYKVKLISVIQNQLEELDEILSNGRTLIIGSSGVGKTTLLNKLIPDLHLVTLPISKVTGKGLHATALAKQYDFKTAGKIIDTPGVKLFSLTGIIDDCTPYFIEFSPYINVCKFRNCKHIQEANCAIKEAVEEGKIHKSRYEHYVEIQSQLVV